MIRNIIIFLVIEICGCLSIKIPSVGTKSGKIVGHYLKSYGGREYEAYLGIPYALPPTGERRFKAPIPIPPWSGKLIANQLQSTCWQLEVIPFPTGEYSRGDEDCLYLNVFVSGKTTNISLPVLFWIYGGGFQYGSSKPGEEAFIMDHDVILVTMDYRLGALGFLSTEDNVVSGNMGLKDQSLALRWIRDNIEYFGGDPEKITIYGHSAGSASVHYHYMSPMSAGLFQNGISSSGTAFSWWAQPQKHPRSKAIELGRLLNCTSSDIEEMIACLRRRPARDIVETQRKVMPMKYLSPIIFGPVVEKSWEDPFLLQSPREVIESGKVYDVPWITGVTSEEGLLPVAEWISNEKLQDFNDNWDEIAPTILGYYDTLPEEEQTRLSRKIRKHYFGDEPINRKTFMNFVYLVGDRWFIVDAENAARAQANANKSPVWFYRYSYRATQSRSFKRTKSSEYLGVCHGDDLYLFMKNTVMTPKSPSDMMMQRRLIETIISFANNNMPNIKKVKWSRVDPTKDLDYLDVGGPRLIKLTRADNLGQRKFWNSIALKK